MVKSFLSVGEEWHTQRQETVCEKFPIRRGENDIQSDRKLFAKGFLHGMGRVVYIVTGNCLRMVSYPTGDDGIHSDRKLFAKGFLSDVGRM